MSYFITKHCKERFAQRIAPFNNVKEILNTVYNGKDITNTIFDKYPRYILYLYERYNECNIKIIQNGNSNFICRNRPGTINMLDVLTCYTGSGYDKFGNTELTRQEIYIRIKMAKSKLKK